MSLTTTPPPVRDRDTRITCDEEFSDSEDEQDPGNRKDNHSYRNNKRPVSCRTLCF